MSQSSKFFAFIAAYAVVSAYALFRLKASPNIWSSGFLIGAMCYVASFLVWLAILRSYPLSVAFPAATGAALLATQLVAYFALGEPISLRLFAGSALIAGGMALLYSRVG